jgi:ATP/maltotriose-dependent transcriptional regulator MalT
MSEARTTTLRQAFRPALVVVFGMTLLLSGCSQGSFESTLAQAKTDAAQAQTKKDAAQAQTQAAQVQKDTQASLTAQVKKLQEAAAQAAKVKAAAAKAAATKKTAAASAPSEVTACGGNLSAGANTTCSFAANVESTYYQSGGGFSTFDVYSPVTGLFYTMSCVPGVPTVCRGGNSAVVYIR